MVLRSGSRVAELVSPAGSQNETQIHAVIGHQKFAAAEKKKLQKRWAKHL